MEAELLNTVKDRYEYRGCGLWVKRQFNSGVVIGQRAGTLLRDGYRQIRVNGKRYREHHLVWLLHKGYVPKEIDNINCVRDDNELKTYVNAPALRICKTASYP